MLNTFCLRYCVLFLSLSIEIGRKMEIFCRISSTSPSSLVCCYSGDRTMNFSMDFSELERALSIFSQCLTIQSVNLFTGVESSEKSVWYLL